MQKIKTIMAYDRCDITGFLCRCKTCGNYETCTIRKCDNCENPVAACLSHSEFNEKKPEDLPVLTKEEIDHMNSVIEKTRALGY